jgi:cell division protein FtsZ
VPFKILTDLYFNNKVKTLPPGSIGFFGCLDEIDMLINTPGLIQLERADVMTVVHAAEEATIVKVERRGENRIREIISNLKKFIPKDSAKLYSGAIFYVLGSDDMTLYDVNEIAETLYNSLDHNADIIFGATIDEKEYMMVKVVLILTK